jgi:hypothetical protein
MVEVTVAPIGADIMRRLIELVWEEVDAQAVARYRAGQVPGDVWADGYETLTVARRFGQFHLQRLVCAHRDRRPHALPGNAFLPPYHGMLVTRGLQEWACLLPQELPFVPVARLLGWQACEADILSTTAVRTLVRAHGGRIRRLERARRGSCCGTARGVASASRGSRRGGHAAGLAGLWS